MRDKKLLWSFVFSAFLVFMLACTAFAVGEHPNWGGVTGTTDIVPVIETTPGYYSSPEGSTTRLEFTVSGTDHEFVDGPPPVATGDTFDALIIRTTSVSGDLDGTAWYSGSDQISLTLKKDEEVSGDFSLSTNIPWDGLDNGESSDVTFRWDFTLEEGIYMTGTLHAPKVDDSTGDLEGDTASCDIGVILLNETPYFDILVGDSNNMEYARSFGPVTSMNKNIDLGTVFLDQNDKIGVVFANFWNEPVVMENISDQGLEEFHTYFAPSLYENGPPDVVQVLDGDSIDPGLALHVNLPYMYEVTENSSFDIEFTDGSVTHLSWFWCYPSIQDGPNAAGMGMYPPASADVNAQITTHVSEVLRANNFDNPTSLENFNLISSADEGQFLGQVSMNISVPGRYEGQVVAVPVGFRLGISGREFEEYDPELTQKIESEIGENATEEQMEAVIRKYFSFKKEWSTGETAQIRLSDEEFKDAVQIFFEYQGDDVRGVYFTANLLIVNGGTAGEVDSVTVDGRTYIVIYDGTLDDRFADPIKIVAAYEEDTSGSSGGGCSAISLVPAAGLLLLPLLMLLKK